MKNTILLLFAMAPSLLSQAKAPAANRAPEAVASDGISKELADAILIELRQIRQLLERQQYPPLAAEPEPVVLRGKVKVPSDDRFLGDAKAPLTMVEFTDYQCPFCREFHRDTFPALKRDFIDTGKLRFVSRDMPLDFHQRAQAAAEAARCAGEQGNFWQMRELLFQDHTKLTPEDFSRYAGQLNLNSALFQNCVGTSKFEVDVRLNLAQAGSLKISGTPAFLIGPTTEEGVEGEIVEGAYPLNVFVEKLNQLLPKP